MSKLLEILGRGIAVNTAGLIWSWLDTVIKGKSDYEMLDEILNVVSLASYDIAQEKIQQYLLERPSCAIGRIAAAAICLEESDLNAAVENLNSVYYRQPSNTIALYALGHCYERLGKEAEAVEFYQDCLKFKNYLELPRLRLAAIYFKNGRIEEAAREYHQQKYEYPDDIETLTLLGHLYLLRGGSRAAIDCFSNAILIHPDNFCISSNEEKIKEALDSGGAIAAVEYINELLAQQGDSAELYLQLADISASNGQKEEAIVYYQKAIRLQPGLLQGFVKLGSLYMAEGNFSSAAELFNKASAINDEIVDAYYGLACAQKQASDNKAAYNTLMLGAAIVQNSAILFSEAARLRFEAAKGAGLAGKTSFRQTLESLMSACRKEPQNQSLLYAAGLMHLKNNSYSDAAEFFKTVAEKNPTHYRAISRLAFCLVEMQKKSEALALLDRKDELSGQTLQLHYKTSLLYCSRRHFIDALKTAKERLDENFQSADAIYALNEVLQNMGLVDRSFAGWNVIGDIISYSSQDGLNC